jgi:NADH dehydrogenase
VVGAGFGGLAVASELAGAAVSVTLVDRHHFNTFQPLLYQVATAGLNPGDIAYPVRAYVRHHPATDFRRGTVCGVDLDARVVCFEDGGTLGYDYLVLAAGASTNHFGVPGAVEHTRAIYTMEDALAVRGQIFDQLERAAAAALGTGGRGTGRSGTGGSGTGGSGTGGSELAGAVAAGLSVVVVGGGPTGIEMSGTLAELLAMELGTAYPDLARSEARVVLVEMGDRLLGAFHPRLGSYAARVLARLGVEVRLSETVSSIDPDKVTLESGEVIPCGLIVWAAGVGAGALASALPLERTRDGRIAVGSDLRVTGRTNVFAIGDMAGALGSDGALLPQLAQPAIQEGRHTGRQIRRLIEGLPTEDFRYHDKGIMATIGRRAAVAQLPGGIRLRGTTAWLAWLALHLVTLVGFRNRVSVLLNWAWRYLSWHRGTRVIVGG